jgi:hypothetical protein
MTPDGTVNEALQKQSLEIYVKLAALTEVPPLDRVFDFSFARKAFAELQEKKWQP